MPAGESTRPTSDRVREAIFNSLYSLDAIDGATVLDPFAGSGALGIEAISRGAVHATFVETDRRALEALRVNVEALGIGRSATVVPGDGVEHLARGHRYDLVLLDPPYEFDRWPDLLGSISHGTVVIESDRGVEVPPGWVVHRVKRYGTTVVTVARSGPQGEETT